jgi:surfactin synthase thioesterase subunit
MSNKTILVKVNGEIRGLNPLELELMMIIGGMSNKLIEAAETIEHFLPHLPEPANDFRAASDYKSYLEQFDI